MNSSEIPPPTPGIEWMLQPENLSDILEAVARKQRRRRRIRTQLGGIAGAAALVAAGFLWVVPFFKERASISTLPERRESLALLDGSHLELNASTEVSTDFRNGVRQVDLRRGEAFFQIARDASHPFVVMTPKGSIRVTGTEFNVRLDSFGEPVVTLLKGAIIFVAENGSEIRMVPGHQLSHAKICELSGAALADVDSWRQGRLSLSGLTLGEAASRMSEYHGKVIKVDRVVADYRMGGSCALDDLPAFLDFLPQALPVKVLKQEDGQFWVRPR